MKKIGLCVCYDTKNFGSQLQVLATQIAMDKLGHDYSVICYKKKLTLKLIITSIPRLCNIYFVKGKLLSYTKNKKISKDREVSENVKKRNGRFVRFANENFRKREIFHTYDELKRGTDKYDAFLTGSDQLWLPSNLGSHFYTQEFVPDNKTKVAYATSFGVSHIPWYQKKRTTKYLSRFNKLSSRELSGSSIIKEMTGLDVPTVVDPTLLLSEQDWLDVILKKSILNEPYIFCFYLGNNIQHREEALKLKKETKYKIVTIPFLDNYVEDDKTFGDYRMFDVDAGDFINLIRNAEYVLTDSFHGSVFSILNHKKFMTFDRFSDVSKDSRNSRIDSLCEMLGLENRRFQGEINNIHQDIDYDSVEKNIEYYRKKSIEYLSSAIGEGRL